jgi:hypothetical protein
VTNLRRLITTPLDRVGVLRRQPFRELVSAEAALARREKVAVVSEELSETPNASEIKAAVRSVKRKAQVLWVLNDDRVLTPNLLTDGWLVGTSERPFIPTIVGARSLIVAGSGFGDFAILPDHTALGTQVAGILLTARERGWALASTEVEPPLSTTTIMDVRQVSDRFKLRSDALSQVDVLLR